MPKTKKQTTSATTITTDHISVPDKQHVAYVIGKGGCNVKKIQEKTGTQISGPRANEKTVFSVTGTTVNVKAAIGEISMLVAEYNAKRNSSNERTFETGKQEKTLVPVSKEAVSAVIGRKGETIKHIQKTTNTEIERLQGNSDAPVFIISGRESNVNKARTMIQAIINSPDGKHPFVSDVTQPSCPGSAKMANGSNGSNKNGKGKIGGNSHTQSFSIDVPVSRDLIGVVIGTQGATVKAIQNDTQTTIVPPDKTDDDPVFRVWGSRQAVSKASQRIEEIIANFTHPLVSNATNASAVNKSPKRSVVTEHFFGPAAINTGSIITSLAAEFASVFEKKLSSVVPTPEDVLGKVSERSPSEPFVDKNNEKSEAKSGPPEPKLRTVKISVPASAIEKLNASDGTAFETVETSSNVKIEELVNSEGSTLMVTGSKAATKKATKLIEVLVAGATSAADTPVPGAPLATNDDQSVGPNTKNPEIVGDNQCMKTVYVSNLSQKVTETQLRNFFQQCGQIKRATILKNGKNALIEFVKLQGFEKALDRLNEKMFQGQAIKVTPKRSPKPSDDKDDIVEPLHTLKMKRCVIIDGDNVCMAHGRNNIYSARGLELAIQYFEGLGHKVLAVVPEEVVRCAPTGQRYQVEGQNILQRLEKAGNIDVVPRKKRSDGTTVKPYTDYHVAKCAFNENGVIISNDNMLDVIEKYPEYKDLIESRRIMFTFGSGENFMTVDDPNGRSGESTADLLHYEAPVANNWSETLDLISFDTPSATDLVTGDSISQKSTENELISFE